MSRPFGNISQSAQGCTSPHLIISYQVPLIYFHHSSHQMTHTECHAELRSPWVPLGIVRGPSTPNLSSVPTAMPSTSCLTVVTPSLYYPHPNTVSSLSTHRHLVIISLFSSYHHFCFRHSYLPFFVFTYILSVILLTPLFFYFMVPLLFSNPDISVPLFIYPLS